MAAVEDLPALPDVAMKVIRLADDPNASALALGRVIGTDQGLTARVLRMANSAFYGVSRRIGTVQEGVVVLGMRTIKVLTLAASVYPVLSRPNNGYSLGRGELWRHSVACGLGAQVLAKHAKPAAPHIGSVTPDEAFVAGLLHDIGKMVIGSLLAGYFEQARALALAENMAFADAERALLGFDHAQAGAAIGEKWNLPAPLVDAIACHHHPLQAQHGNIGLACVAHVADALSLTLGIGVGGDGLLFALQPAALEALSLTTAQLDELAGVVVEALREAGSSFDFEKAA